MADRYKTLLERFWSKVARGDGCWIWHGAHGEPGGYGRIRHQNRQLMAHRVSYEINVGPIPEDMTIDHLCRNKECVNPDHLEVVTRGENTQRYMRAITRCPRGHDYNDENTRYDRRGVRSCRACQRERWRENNPTVLATRGAS